MIVLENRRKGREEREEEGGKRIGDRKEREGKLITELILLWDSVPKVQERSNELSWVFICACSVKAGERDNAIFMNAVFAPLRELSTFSIKINLISGCTSRKMVGWEKWSGPSPRFRETVWLNPLAWLSCGWASHSRKPQEFLKTQNWWHAKFFPPFLFLILHISKSTEVSTPACFLLIGALPFLCIEYSVFSSWYSKRDECQHMPNIYILFF